MIKKKKKIGLLHQLEAGAGHLHHLEASIIPGQEIVVIGNVLSFIFFTL
ncbi:hypothetical protein HanPI659440_Chr13g0509281 [Helianthus annuus]|nr:hypothetical protein HanPI659440_Chr13g0509281 [Helianthus annuus]